MSTLPPDPEPAAVALPATARLTLKSVAQALGVSRTTASNAFNRPGQLSPALRERILRGARDLGYFGPDPAARAMRNRQLRDVAVILPQDLRYALDDPLSLDFLRGIAAELDGRGLNLHLIPKLGRPAQVEAAFQTTADALVVHAEIDAQLAPQVLASRKPLVLVDAFLPGVRTVGNDDRGGARLAMAHALSRAPDCVWVVHFRIAPPVRTLAQAGEHAPHTGYIAGERMAGYVAALQASGFPAAAVRWIEVDERRPEMARDVLASLQGALSRGTRLAMLCMSDRMAIAALDVARAWQTVTLCSVVGFDDGRAAAAAGLTTVRQDPVLKGRRAVEALLDGKDFALEPLELLVRAT